MRYTLLELTKRILESMESDEVSDINETPESIAVANIVKECYFDIAGQFNPAELVGLYKLDGSGDSNKPVLMTVPSHASRIKWLKYNIGTVDFPDWQDLRYLSNEEYFHYQSGLDVADTDILQMTTAINATNFVFHYRDNAFPTCYTVFDDFSVIFDSYNADVETTLTQVRSLAYGPLVAEFEFENEWTPDLDPRQFQLLLQEAKATAFVELKQTSNPTAERKARKNAILTQKNKYDNAPAWSGQSHVGFGRRGPMNSDIRRAMRNGN